MSGTVGQIGWWLVVLGAINWGLNAFGYNLVETIFGSWPSVEMVVYVLIGLAGLWMLYEKFARK